MEHVPSTAFSTLLLIDDSSEDRETFRRFLQQDSKSAYQILEAESGEQGLQRLDQLLAQSGCDLVLLDFYLPDMDGLDLLRLFKQRALLGMPILILTGLEDEQIAAQAIGLGAQDYIAKQQLTAEILQFAVRAALRQAALYQQLQLTNQRLEARVQARTDELQQVNTKLHDLNESLKISNQDLEQFAYIASHDLREPLRKVKSFADLLARRYQGQLDETADRYLHYMTDGVVRMQALINDLLTYSRLGTQDLAKATTDLNQVLGQALETLHEKIQQKQAVVQAGTLPVLQVDALQLEQLFKNLIENALKYSRDDAPPQITITAENRNRDWLITVQDNGIGIEAEFCDRIFVIFQRLHTQSEYSGTGIGLAICKKIVERHGGTIGVTSTPNIGSTFWFTLPSATDSSSTTIEIMGLE
ncbi:MAG: ATP-binding protein [Cyanobacteria bacterium P01_A01_bin.114]